MFIPPRPLDQGPGPGVLPSRPFVVLCCLLPVACSLLPLCFQPSAFPIPHSSSIPRSLDPLIPAGEAGLSDPLFPSQWALLNTGQEVQGTSGTPGADIRAAEAWDFWTGDDEFLVAVIDTGVNLSHPDLAANIWTNPNEIPGNGLDDDNNGYIDDVHGYDFAYDDPDPTDGDGHGTRVAGVIAAAANNGVGISGVAPRVKIVALRAIYPGGLTNNSKVAEALRYAVDNGIRVSNHSYAGTNFHQGLYDAIEYANAHGHLVIAGAGNSGLNIDLIPFYPAGHDLPNIISVMGSSQTDTLAAGNNFGAYRVDLAAPAPKIISTTITGSYGYSNGSSFSVAHVTGVAALVWSRQPQLTREQVVDRLLLTARPVPALAGLCRTGGVVNAVAAVADCNGNGVLDELDIQAGTSQDCTGNTVPDECEPDCNANGTADTCDIIAGTSLDCTANGTPDECEPDCNANGIADSCDIADGTSTDCNDDSVPDECQPADCNGNGVYDVCDLTLGTAKDCNSNYVPDTCDVAGGFSDDCNGNLEPDECEADCNDNGVQDECDVRDGTSDDCNQNGEPDECEPGGLEDCNQNQVTDWCDIRYGISKDCNENKVPDECEPGGLDDCNLNGQTDWCDIRSRTSPDCNENWVPDECDIVAGTSSDCDGNVVPDECDPDCNANGIADACDISAGTSIDCDENVVPDECQADCNANGIADPCDIRDGTSLDANGDGVPDECALIRRVPSDYPTIQAAVEAALAGDVILLDPGSYAGEGNRRLIIGHKPLRFRCDGDLGDCVISLESMMRSSIELYGTAETQYAFERLVFRESLGTAIYAWGCKLVVLDCVFANNRGDFLGGAISLHSGVIARVAGSEFRSNTANQGGAITVTNSEVTLVECLFESNSAELDGGAVSSEYSTVVTESCTFARNQQTGVSGSGGAVYAEHSSIDILRSRFVFNQANSAGAVSLYKSRGQIAHSLFVNNSASRTAGALALFANPDGPFMLSSCSVVNNSADIAGGALRGSASLVSSQVWGNTAPIGSQIQAVGEVVVVHSNVESGAAGIDASPSEVNLVSMTDADPMFIDHLGPDGLPGTGDEDYRLSPGSPCINTGDPTYSPDPGETDLDGRPRRVGCRVDMGAYESKMDQAHGDFDGDGQPTLSDLAAFQQCLQAESIRPDWSAACTCIFDATGDGSVDLADWPAVLTALDAEPSPTRNPPPRLAR